MTHRLNSLSARLAVTLAASGLAYPALAETIEPAEDTAVDHAETATPEVIDETTPIGAPLSGPAVETTADRTTAESGIMVRRDFTGDVDIPRGQPELLALDRLDLDERTRSAVETVIADRAGAVDSIVRANLETVFNAAMALRTARDRNGRTPEAAAAIRSMMQLLEPIRQRGTLREELIAVLPPDLAAQFNTLLEDYAEAMLAMGRDGQMDMTRARDMAGSRNVGSGRVNIRAYLTEIQQSYDRVLVQQIEDFNAFLAEADLSSEGESRVRRAIQSADRASSLTDASGSFGGNRGQVIAVLVRQLDADDRAKLIAAIKSRLGVDEGERPRGRRAIPARRRPMESDRG